MTKREYIDPRSIYSEENIRKCRTRTPEEILKQIRSEEPLRKDLLDYWQNPNDGLNDPEKYLDPIGWVRSYHLYDLISELIPREQKPRVLELGSNVGRNLLMLRFGGYQDLTGIELSKSAVNLMRKTFPTAITIKILVGEIEKLMYDLRSRSFDIVFTMAVLEHLPVESEHVFKEMARVTNTYLITIEDEKCTSWRHFPRQYDKIFKRVGMKQVMAEKNLVGLSKSFVCRVFKKED